MNEINQKLNKIDQDLQDLNKKNQSQNIEYKLEATDFTNSDKWFTYTQFLNKKLEDLRSKALIEKEEEEMGECKKYERYYKKRSEEESEDERNLVDYSSDYKLRGDIYTYEEKEIIKELIRIKYIKKYGYEKELINKLIDKCLNFRYTEELVERLLQDKYTDEEIEDLLYDVYRWYCKK